MRHMKLDSAVLEFILNLYYFPFDTRHAVFIAFR